MNINIKPTDINRAASAARRIKEAYAGIAILVNDADGFGILGDDRAVQLAALFKTVEEAQEDLQPVADAAKNFKPQDKAELAKAEKAKADAVKQPFAPPEPATIHRPAPAPVKVAAEKEK